MNFFAVTNAFSHTHGSCLSFPPKDKWNYAIPENIDTYNKDYFDNKAKLICIGKGTETRSFLTPYNNEYKELLDETIKLKNES